MNREVHIPESRDAWLKLRAGDTTSTEVPALFGLSPYQTEFELFHRHREKAVVEIEPNERMKWGTRVEPAIAHGLAEDNGWEIRRMNEYMRLPAHRLGASFDYAIGDDGILECKNVDALAYRDGWLVEGDEVEAPPHIELQVQTQLAVSGRKFAYIGALVGGNRAVVLRREPDPEVFGQILEKVNAFWYAVDMGIEPKPDYARDAEFIKSLYSHAEPGKVIDLSADQRMKDLADGYRFQSELEKQSKERKESYKAQMLALAGDAERVVGDGFTISLGIVPGGPVAYERPSYRNFRVSWRRPK